MNSLRYKAAIVGASETTELGSIPDKTAFQLHVDASVNAINDCGIDKNEIDGIATTMSPAALAHYLGIIPTWIDNTQVGGTSFLVHVRHAAAAIASGLCETVLVAMAESGRNRVGEQAGRIGDVASMSGGRRPDHTIWYGCASLHERNRSNTRTTSVGSCCTAQMGQQSSAGHVSGHYHNRGRI